MGDETQKKRRPEFDLAFATPTGLMLAEAKAFPDYLKMIERMIPKLGPLIDRYMEVARLDTRLLDQLTRIDTNELIEQAVASRASALTAAEPAPRVEEMLSRIAISTQFPDFSKLFEERYRPSVHGVCGGDASGEGSGRRLREGGGRHGGWSHRNGKRR